VVINPRVSFSLEVDIKEAVRTKLINHMVKERDLALGRADACAIEVDCKFYIGLLCLAFHSGNSAYNKAAILFFTVTVRQRIQPGRRKKVRIKYATSSNEIDTYLSSHLH